MADSQPEQSSKTNEGKEEEEELSALLDSALQDFGTTVSKSPDDKTPTSTSSTTAGGADDPPIEDESLDFPPHPLFMDPAMAQRAAGDFHKMIQQLAEMQKAAIGDAAGLTGADAAGPTASAAPSTDAVAGHSTTDQSAASASADEQAFAAAMMENLTMLAAKAEKVGTASNETDFKSALDELHSDEAFENEFLPFMGGLMGTLLSKDMLYPSMSEIVERYPSWLEENQEKTPPEDVERYKAQLEVMKEVCKEYETEKEDDSEEIQTTRFQKIIVLLQQMQCLGHPPAELVGDLPSGWSFDQATGIPTIVDQSAAAESCVIM